MGITGAITTFVLIFHAQFFDGLELAKVKDPMLVSTVACFACYISTAFVDYFAYASEYQVVAVCLVGKFPVTVYS